MATALKVAYATYPSVKLKGFKTDKKTGQKKFTFLKELLFGDFVKPYLTNNKYETKSVIERNKESTYIKVRARGTDGYLKETEIQAQRVLEVNFIDVGQGDGCHLVTPDDKHFIIDAGPGDNMYRFLKWRFNLAKSKTPPPPFTIIVSHSDSDHYKGFGKIFDLSKGTKQQFTVNKIYHNGLVEVSGAGTDSLGKRVTKNGQDYITDLCDTNSSFEKRASTAEKAGVFITTLNKSKAAKASLRLGSPSLYDKNGLSIDVIGPVSEKINGKDALRVFDKDKGKTKNGHSIVLKLAYGNVKLLLGGDLNTESEYHLLKHFTKVDVAAIKKELLAKSTTEARKKKLEAQLAEAIEKARKVLQVDIAKSCHHGSADFTSEFLRALNPLATIVSSGDNEPHTHPRPDTLGTIGKHSRGDRSLIFSTELARSGKEFVEVAKMNTAKKKERVVTVYGMINVRTDGKQVVIAQKLERAAAGRSWDIHTLEWNATTKEFEYRQYLKYQ